MKRRYELGNSDTGEYDYRQKSQKNNIHHVNNILATTFSIYIIVLFLIVYFVDSHLPAPLKIEDEKLNPGRFIAERAQKDLKLLTDIGPKVVGSRENEDLAVNFLLKRVNEIKENANAVHNIEIDVQTVSGSYYIDYKPFGGYNAYGNVQNIVVKVNSKENKKGILINAHFDTVPTSPGGSDDGINCAVLLETLRIVTLSDKIPDNNIVFLFNGAEESPLQAAHGFITQHKWREDVGIVINLEAAGHGSKEILFQSGPDHSWLLNYYKNVPHPHGQAAGEEIFQSNLIPSDTDFRLFRDFGGLVGYDMAFARNGYRYHTNHDDFEHIPLGSYQHVGDNVLSLIENLAGAEEINEERSSSTKAVYFDVFGLFMISYGEWIGFGVNLIVAALSVFTFKINLTGFGLRFNRGVVVYLISAVGAILFGWALAVGVILSLAVLLDKYNLTMMWYSRPWLLVGLYVMPTLAASALPLILFNKFKRSGNMEINVQSQLQAHIVRLIWTLVLFVATCFRIRTAYAFMIPVLFNSLGFLMLYITRQQHSVKLWRFFCEVANTFPTMMVFYQMILILTLFIPITGRIGNTRNPDMIIGVIVVTLTILFSSFFIHFVTVLKKPAIIFIPCVVTFFLTIAFILSPLSFQYTGDPNSPAQERYMIFHTRRVFHDETANIVKEDSGYFVINLDRNAPRIVEPYVKTLQKRTSISDDCKNMVACGLPLLHPRVLEILEQQMWIPSPPPLINDNVYLKLIKKRAITSTTTRFVFEASGPPHLNVYFSPKNGTRFVRTDLSDVVPENTAMWNGRRAYFVNYTWGKERRALRFYLDFETPENWTMPVFDIAVSGKTFYNKIDGFTGDFQAFIREFPEWANVAPAVSSFESWVF